MVSRTVLSLLACSFIAVGPAAAGPNAQSKVLFHLTAPTTKTTCLSGLSIPRCDQIITAGDLYPHLYYAYLLVTGGDCAAGIAGLQCGVTYDSTAHSGVDIFSWTNCATLEFQSPGWPNAGTGNLITWDHVNACQRSEPGGVGTGVTTVAGYFYCAAYSADNLAVTWHPVTGTVEISSCTAEVDTISTPSSGQPSPLGFASFSQSASSPGYSPCEMLDHTCQYNHPRIANYFLTPIFNRPVWHTGSDLQNIARWDVVILDYDTPGTVLDTLHTINPQMRILRYISLHSVMANPESLADSCYQRRLYNVMNANDWWLHDTHGGRIREWIANVRKYDGMTTNLSSLCPEDSTGSKLMDWLPEFIAGETSNTQWDGVFLDNAWDAICWVGVDTVLNEYPIDMNRDGIADDRSTLDSLWNAGSDSVVCRLRRLLPNKILVGNGGNHFASLNGAMIEGFPFNSPGQSFPEEWSRAMFGPYGYDIDEIQYSSSPQMMNVIDSYWQTEGSDMYSTPSSAAFRQYLRRGLVSCMLGDGYYAMNAYASQMWWSPEYEVPIGDPVGPKYMVGVPGDTLRIWKRDFSNGMVTLNPNNSWYPGSQSEGIWPLSPWEARITLSSELWQGEGSSVPDLPSTHDFYVGLPFPNPSTGHVRVLMSTAQHGLARPVLDLYDIAGRHIRTIQSQATAGNQFYFDWDGRTETRRLASNGIYFAVFKSSGRTEVRKIVLTR